MSQEQAVDFLSFHCKLGIQLKYSVVLLKIHLEESVRASSFPKSGVTLPAETSFIPVSFPLCVILDVSLKLRDVTPTMGWSAEIPGFTHSWNWASASASQCSCTCKIVGELRTWSFSERTKMKHPQTLHCWINWGRKMDLKDFRATFLHPNLYHCSIAISIWHQGCCLESWSPSWWYDTIWISA